ncbi:MAG TPA: cysteine hydrolase family protein [Geobacterales bacterium]|nr:cysteine hydrolase family protein [Geobacterales bacterium]
MKRALLIIDIQNDYFTDGRMPVAGALEASLRAKVLLDLFREKKLPLFHVQHISTRKGATFLLPATPGVEIHETVSPLPGEVVITKQYPNSFRETELLAHLRALEVTQLVICGMMTHMCVDATVRAAFDHGFDCITIHDACATRDLLFNGATVPAPMVQGAFLAALGAVYAKIVSSDQFVAGV